MPLSGLITKYRGCLSLPYRYERQIQGNIGILISHDYDRWLWIYYREYVGHWSLSLSILL